MIDFTLTEIELLQMALRIANEDGSLYPNPSDIRETRRISKRVNALEIKLRNEWRKIAGFEEWPSH